jgi:dihydropteroate synthase
MPNTIWQCGEYALALGAKTYVMGIVNATPDSFSGDGVLVDGVLGTSAVDRALKMIDDGADILDIGGESTRPGAAVVSVEEEKSRVLPLLEALAKKVEVPISVDTTKSEVARAALDAGASIINDISAGTFDAAMLGVLAPSRCGVVLMHLRGTPQSMKWSQAAGEGVGGRGVIEEVLAFWQGRVDAVRAAGIDEARICLDPGFGFGKSVSENLELLRRGQELKNFGFALLAATSRKSTIGKVLGDASGDLPVEERLFGTAATVAVAIHNGADVVRVHDVKAMAQVARMTDAIVRHA